MSDAETVAKACEVMRRYLDWFIYAPEDGWRLQRDMCAVLGIDESDE